MRYRLLILVSSMMIAIFSATAFSYQNEPEGFRDDRWGTNYKDMPGLSGLTGNRDSSNNLKYYTATADSYKRKIGDISVDSIWYYFTPDEKLYKVVIDVSDTRRVLSLDETVKAKFGDPDSQSNELKGTTYKWNGKKTNIRFIRNHSNHKIAIWESRGKSGRA